MTNLLSGRFSDDGEPTVDISDHQEQLVSQIRQKISDGVYEFENKDCCVCQNENFDTLSEKDRYGIPHPVKICVRCGLVQQTPVLTKDSYEEFYNTENWGLYRSDYPTAQSYFHKQYRAAESIDTYLKNHYPGYFSELNILDVGCGAGGMVAYFEDNGHTATGCDLGESLVKFGRDEYDLDLRLGSTSDLNLDRSYDLVVYADVLEHIHNPVIELKKIRSEVASSATVFIRLPGIKHLSSSYRGDFLRMLQNSHIYYFTLKSLTNTIHQAGFKMVEGNERIDCLIRPDGESGYDSCYKETMEFLNWMEYRRHFPRSGDIKRAVAHPAIKRGLKRVGLYGIARRLHSRL